MPRAQAERILITRVIIAVGLAVVLALAAGAWSVAHGSADVHTTLCVADEVPAPADAALDADTTVNATAIDVHAADACLAAVLCCVALALWFRRLPGARSRPLGTRSLHLLSLPRAGPIALVPALSLAQLSISRT